MRKLMLLLAALVLGSFLAGCNDGVSEAQANDRAKQMEEAKNRPDQQGTQD